MVFENEGVLYPDTLVGTDSHTTMINGLGVLGWGVGGIEAEAAMLGQPMSMLIPRVVGFKLGGELPEGATATDLVLTVTQMLREHGVVGKFVEFYGPGIPNTPLADRATIGNMSPGVRLDVRDLPDRRRDAPLHALHRPLQEQCEIVEAYAREQGLWHDEDTEEPTYSETLELDLGDVVPVAGGPEAPAGPRLADRVQGGVPAARWRTLLPDAEDEAEADEPACPSTAVGDTDVDEESEGSFPASDPPSHNGHGSGHRRLRAGATAAPAALQVAEREEHHVDLTLEDGTETELDHGTS